MIEVTSADRVVYPDAGITKGEVVAYFQHAAPALLPHLRDRPITLFRHPRGLGARGFFQKQAKDYYPDFLPRIEVPKRGGANAHVSVTDADGLAYLANQGTLELHVPLARAPDLNVPDHLVLDLDPPPGALQAVRESAHLARALLDELALPSVPVATGGKGYHLYVAVEPDGTSRDVHEVAHTLAAVLAHRHSESLTVEILKENRAGRVLLDWMRNGFGATVIAPWSLRARPGAPVAVPIHWDEFDAIAPNHFSLRTVASRLEMPDPLLALERVSLAALVERCAELRDTLGIELAHVDRFGRKRDR